MKNKGFTLIELSIVLIIISLVVAAVTGGKVLIKQAELQSIATDVSKYKTAFNTFRLKYNAIPGDFDNATSYWGLETDNGNGDGNICCRWSENFYIWNHLGLAQIIAGSYGKVSLTNPVPGIHIPKTSINGSGWWSFSSGVIGHGWNFAAPPIYGRTGNVFGIGAQNGQDYLDGGVLSASDMANLDKKMDDGKPDGGDIFAIRGVKPGGGYEAGCVNQNPPSLLPISYSLNDSAPDCHPIFFLEE